MELDVTLAAIVRDEQTNAAGGIRSFLESTMPYVRRAVIVDTGSVDGTRDYLADAARQDSRLTVLDRRFKNFSDARNYGLARVKTRYALVLDADERMTPDAYETLADDMAIHPKASGFVFLFKTEPRTLWPGDKRALYGTFPIRLFEAKGWRFQRPVFEEPWPRWFSGIRTYGISPLTTITRLERSEAVITHYLCSPEQRKAKHEWYVQLAKEGKKALARRPKLTIPTRTKEQSLREFSEILDIPGGLF